MTDDAARLAEIEERDRRAQKLFPWSQAEHDRHDLLSQLRAHKQSAAREAALAAALGKIAGLVDSEAGEPLDDAIRIANVALANISPQAAALLKAVGVVGVARKVSEFINTHYTPGRDAPPRYALVCIELTKALALLDGASK